MEVFVSDTRRRFGRDTSYFQDTEVQDLEYVERDPTIAVDYEDINPSTIELDTSVELSMHTVNTNVIQTGVANISHKQGGWPKDIDPEENQDVKRFRKKVEKAEPYKAAVKRLGDVVGDGGADEQYSRYLRGVF